MTDIEKRALELWGPGIAAEVNIHNFSILGSAFIEMRDRHEAFKQEVSDVVESITSTTVDDGVWRGWASDRLSKFIIPKPKPDPLVDVAESLGYFNTAAQGWAGDVRAALDARGLEIREQGQ